jgi:hypothetical protein
MKRTACGAGFRGLLAEAAYLGFQLSCACVASARGVLEYGLQIRVRDGTRAGAKTVLSVFCRFKQLVQGSNDFLTLHCSLLVNRVRSVGRFPTAWSLAELLPGA